MKLKKALDQGSLDNLAQATTNVGTAEKGSFDDNKSNSVKTKATISSTGTGNLKLLLQLYPELKCYKDPFECSVGVTIEQKGTNIFKKVELLDSKEWSCLVNSLKNTHKDKKTGFKNNTNSLDDKMFLYAKCLVLIPNTDLLDEGHMSEYKDPFGVLAQLGEGKDLKFNQTPEVLVMDHDKKDEVPISFHDLHLLGNTAGNYHSAVLGKKHKSLALSPSKAVQKRKSVFLSDAQSTAKRPKLT
ncbi:hypothetical protein K435DRAFT_837570 [Dendrothele bispora CBS 962.96]|uniref:Uncharacterized protein n=1 Tax=Dendrothele bispora (strain CBS 962.96) TaxID=1314807 RepID=A0A4S8MCQ2_DENBC|nr:hypothetical protein K435DRAFT_837570 [Dendrothele bispora CBS 962.96]